MDKQRGAIPEAKSTKADLIRSKTYAQQRLAEFHRNRYKDQFDEMRKAIVSFYWDLQPHLLDLEANNGKDFSKLHELQQRPKTFESWEDIGEEEVEFWREMFQRLNQALYDLGVTKISLEKRSQAYGYEFLNGLDHNLKKKEDPGWRRLKNNLKNMRRLLRKDTDIVGLVYGGNRTGKTTLSLQATRIVQTGQNKGDLDDKHFIFNDDDFRNSMDNGERYQANHIDEMSLLFHKRDGMNTEQKERNKMMKTYAVKNMFMVGCDNNFYNIDQEFISDKVDFVIHVPKRGRFEFYSKAKVKKFKKGDDGTPETPSPDITGRFPDLDPDNQKRDPLWETYKEQEHKKLEVSEDEEDGGARLKRIVEEVKEEPEEFKKELEGRDPIISHRLISIEYPDLSNEQAKAVKDAVEQKVNLSD